MARTHKARVSGDAWETRKLGAEEEYARAAEAFEGIALDEALDLHMISIRLPKTLIGQLKLIAHFNGVGYQPLMRDILSRYARNGVLEILRQQSEIAELERRKDEAEAKAQAKAEQKKAA
jgi:hypothetical protein